MRLVVTLFIPAMEKRAIKWMFCDVLPVSIDIFHPNLGNELRNPLAFVHEELNLPTAQMMSKPARTSFWEEQDGPPRVVGVLQSVRLCQEKK